MPDNPNYTLNYALPYKRIMQLSRTANRQSFRDVWVLSWIWRALFIVLAAGMFLRPNKSVELLYLINAWFGLPAAATWVPIIVMLFAYFGGLIAIRKLYQKRIQEHVDFDEEIRMTYEAEGVRFSGRTIEYFLKWEGVREVFTEHDGLVLSQGAMFFLVPDSAFSDEDQRRAFLRDVLKKIDDEARERSEKQVAHALQD